jgi:hypothetical protein
MLTARVAATLTIAALIAVAGVAIIGGAGGRTGPAASPSATANAAATAAPTPIPIPPLTETFVSPRNGYSIKVPAGWQTTPGTASWQHGKPILWGDPALDAIQGSDARFVGAAQLRGAGESTDQWLKAYCMSSGGDPSHCDDAPASWERIRIAGWDGYLDLAGVPAAGGTIVPGGRIFDAVTVVGTTAYAFTLDGNVDRAMFDAFADTITVAMADVVSLPPLNGRFVSPANGFSIATADGWTVDPATQAWVGVDNESPAMDGVNITGTDTSVTGASQRLGSQTYEQFLAAFHANTLKDVPSGCDGGEPSTWPSIQVGDQTGGLEMLCNAAEALVHVGDRVYLFDWGNETFDADRHMSLASWKALLRTVVFDPASSRP